MAGKKHEEDVTGLKYFDKLGPLLMRLHEAGTERDTAGNRQLPFDQYCLLVLLLLFTPVQPSNRTGLSRGSFPEAAPTVSWPG